MRSWWWSHISTCWPCQRHSCQAFGPTALLSQGRVLGLWCYKTRSCPFGRPSGHALSAPTKGLQREDGKDHRRHQSMRAIRLRSMLHKLTKAAVRSGLWVFEDGSCNQRVRTRMIRDNKRAKGCNLPSKWVIRVNYNLLHCVSFFLWNFASCHRISLRAHATDSTRCPLESGSLRANHGRRREAACHDRKRNEKEKLHCEFQASNRSTTTEWSEKSFD